MSALAFALIVFAAQLIGWACGRWMRRRLPPEHLDTRTRDSVMLLVGMVATLSALVLGLMISTAKTSFDADKASVIEIAADILLIDHALAQYGRRVKGCTRTAARIHERCRRWRFSPDRPEQALDVTAAPLPQMGRLQQSLLALSPATDAQRWLQARALTLSSELKRARVLFAEHASGSIPPAFLFVLTAWLAMLYIALAIFAPSNLTSTLTAVGGALAFSAAIFLILELDTPFHGLISLSSEPLVKTLELLGR